MKKSVLKTFTECALVVGIAFIDAVPVSAESGVQNHDCTVGEAEVLQDTSVYARVCNRCGNGTLSIISTSYGV